MNEPINLRYISANFTSWIKIIALLIAWAALADIQQYIIQFNDQIGAL